MGRGRRDRRARDRGVVAVLSVFFVVLLLGLLALVINVGRLMRTRGDLQHAADSAALAAMESLDNKPTGGVPGRDNLDYNGSPLSIQAMATRFAQKYQLGGGDVPTVDTTMGGSIVNNDFAVGFWHEKSGPDE